MKVFKLLIGLFLFSILSCSPIKPTETCLDPRIVAPSNDGKTVGVSDEHFNIHWVPTNGIPMCRPDQLKPLR